MISDVPFGCFLSGGIDSSTNAVLMSRALGHPVQTFSVGYHLEKYNELQWSQRIANLIGTKPNEIILTEKELLEFIETGPYFLDDLNSDYISFPVFYLSKFTRQKGVIVIQIGEGSDEIFAGYQTYLNAFKLYNLFWQKLARLPAFLRKAVWGAAENFSACRFSVYQRYLERLAKKQNPFWGLAEAFPEYQKKRLLTLEFQKNLPTNLIHEQFVQKIYKQIKTIDPAADFLKQLTYLELKHRLPELLLARADKMTMAHSVEGRVPFLDKRLVELSFTIPSWLKFKQNQPKYILKKTVEKILPPEIVWRTKQGFSAPMNEWLKPHTPTGHYLSQKIFNSKLKELNILNYNYVRDLIRANCYHNNGHIFRIWNLIMLSVWYDYWFG
jgi:asparagine synthase (glutamine-hydrolysing)